MRKSNQTRPNNKSEKWANFACQGSSALRRDEPAASDFHACRPKRNAFLGTLCAILGNIIFGFSFILTKIAFHVESLTVPVLLMWRFLIAFLIMNLLIPLTKQKLTLWKKEKRKHLPMLLSLGLIEPILYFVFENYGLLYTTATMSAVILSLIPVISMGIGALLLHERPTFLQVIFSLIAIACALFMSLQQAGQSGSSTFGGALCLTVAAFLAALFYVVSRHLSVKFTPFERTYIIFGEGLLFFSGMALIQNIQSPEKLVLPFTDFRFLIALLYLSILSSVIAYMCINYATSNLSVTQIGALANVQNTISIFAGIAFLGDYADIFTVLAAIITIISVYCVQHFRRDSLQSQRRAPDSASQASIREDSAEPPKLH